MIKNSPLKTYLKKKSIFKNTKRDASYLKKNIRCQDKDNILNMSFNYLSSH